MTPAFIAICGAVALAAHVGVWFFDRRNRVRRSQRELDRRMVRCILDARERGVQAPTFGRMRKRAASLSATRPATNLGTESITAARRFAQ